MNTNPISKLLKATQLAIQGLSEDKALQKQMAAFGFTLKQTQDGKTILARVKLIAGTREENANTMRRLSHQINEDGKATMNVFRDHAAIARAAFRQEPLVLQELKISKLDQSKWGWVQQALDFYEQAPKHLAHLQKFGATTEAFGQNQAAAQALFDMRAQRLNRKGKAEHNTQERNAAIRELRTWYSDFRRLARVAFRESPQLLETFGIVVSTNPRKRKSAVKASAEAVEVPAEAAEAPVTEAPVSEQL